MRMSLRQTLLDYIYLTKMKITSLLVFTSAMTLILASILTGITVSWAYGLFAIVMITFACASANTLTCYLDRDIDGVMDRTKERPLPTGRISPPEKALAFGLTMLAISLIGSLLVINLISMIVILIGFADNVGIYSYVLKRRSALNIILGGISGGMPALFGWTAVTSNVALLPILLAVLIMLWTPNHIWNLAIYYREDYKRAGVPMLPVVVNIERAIRIIVLTVIIMFPLSLLPFFLAKIGPIYLIVALGFGLIVLAGNIYTLYKPTVDHAWTMFKLSSPYLFLLFTALVLGAIIK